MFILSYLKIYAATTFIDKRILNNICFSFFWWRFLYKLITMPLWVIWYAHKYFHCVRMCVCHVKNFWKDREWSFHSVFNHRRTLTTLLCYFFHIFCASIAHQMYIILVFCHSFYKVSGHLFVMWILMEISFEYLIVLN